MAESRISVQRKPNQFIKLGSWLYHFVPDYMNLLNGEGVNLDSLLYRFISQIDKLNKL